MAERLATTRESTPTVDPETIAEIDSVEDNLDQETINRLAEARERVARLMEEIGPSTAEVSSESPTEDTAATRELPAPTTEHPANPVDEEPLSQDEIYDTYANNIAYSAEKERLIDPRSRLRKIGDSVLRLQERIGKSTPAKLLARWGIIPPIGTRHTQRGFNFSAWAARKYVKAQEARKNREARIRAGFLSVEDQAHLDAMDETQPIPPTAEAEKTPTPDKETGSPKTPETVEDEVSYVDDLATETERKKAEEEAEHEAKESTSPSGGIDDEAKPDNHEDDAAASPERKRHEAHDRAERAAADREERHERRPIREHAANLKERLVRLKGRIGSSAMKLFGRAKAGVKSAAGALRRGR